MKLLGNRLLVEIEPRRWRAGQISLVERMRPSANCKVVAVGSKVDKSFGLVPGTRLGFLPHRGKDVEVGGRRLRLLEIDDVLGIVGGELG